MMDALPDIADQIKLLEELDKMFSKIGSQAAGGFNIAKGANFQLLSTINRNIGAVTEKTLAFERRTEIFKAGTNDLFSVRFYDEIIEVVVNNLKKTKKVEQ
jgi:hypothetical protein